MRSPQIHAPFAPRVRRRLALGLALLAVAGCATAGWLLAPRARDAAALLWAQDDPAALADARTARLGADRAIAEIEAALAAHDPDLARSFVDLAASRGLALPPDLTARVATAVAAEASAGAVAGRFAKGFVTGEGDDLAGMSGTVAGDLFVFGDIRDLVREGGRLIAGQETDRLLLGLAATGLVVTAATYVSAGGAAPARAGLTLVKDARKTGRLGAGFAGWAGRAAGDVIDTPQLRTALAEASLARPAATVASLRTAVRADKAAVLVRAVKDVGRIGEKAGSRGAMDALRLAEGPGDLARAARLADKKTTQSRALFKLFGRGALLLASGGFQLALWLFGALLSLVGLLASIKATTERLTEGYCRRRRARALRRAATRAERPAPAGLAAPAAIG
jgi:hypothetical protein